MIVSNGVCFHYCSTCGVQIVANMIPQGELCKLRNPNLQCMKCISNKR